MRLRGLLVGFVLVLSSACGEIGLDLGGAQGECASAISELNRARQSANQPADPARLEVLVDEALPCISASDLVETADAWHLDGVDLPETATQCFEPFVDAAPESFLVVGHNQTHRLPTAEPHHQRWVEAMAECVPASYVLNSRLPPLFTEPENLACYDEVYEAANLVPFFDNINTFDDRVAYSDWPEEKLHTFYGPMYQCADFIGASLAPDFIAALSDQAMACIKRLPAEFLLFTRETVPAGYNDAYSGAISACIPEDEAQALKDAGY